MEGVLGLMGKQLLVVGRADHTLEDQGVILGKEADDGARNVRRPTFSDDQLAFFGQLLTGHCCILTRCLELQLVQPMLEDSLPVWQVKHFWEVIVDDVGTLRDGVEDEVAGEADLNLLEDKSALSYHQYWHFIHLVQRAKTVGFLLVGVLRNTSH